MPNLHSIAPLTLLAVAFFITCPVYGQLSEFNQHPLANHQQLPMADTTAKLVQAIVDSIPKTAAARLDSTNRLQHVSDSVRNLRLRAGKKAAMLDSALRSFSERVRSGIVDDAEHRVGFAAEQAELDSLVMEIKSLDSMAMRLGLNDLHQAEAGLDMFNRSSPANLGLSPIPEISGVHEGIHLPDLNLSPATVPAIPQVAAPGVALPVNPLTTDLGGTTRIVKGITENVDAIAVEGKKLREGDIQTLAEKKALDQLQQLEPLQSAAGEIKSAETLKQQGEVLNQLGDQERIAEKAKEEFVDHLAGKEDIVQKDMEDISKLQVKYRDVADSRFLPKRPPNPMKGKPFVERLIPGMSFQMFQGSGFAVDMAPFIGYRFSGAISAGIGGYRRVAYFSGSDALTLLDYYGARLYTQVRVIKKLCAHVELERYKPSTDNTTFPPMPDATAWSTKLNVGANYRYKINKRLNGNFLIMYDMIQLKQFPNSSGSSVRFGIDYQVRKKRSKEKT